MRIVAGRGLLWSGSPESRFGEFLGDICIQIIAKGTDEEAAARKTSQRPGRTDGSDIAQNSNSNSNSPNSNHARFRRSSIRRPRREQANHVHRRRSQDA